MMLRYLKCYYFVIIVLLLSTKSMASINPEAERYISSIIHKHVPYQVNVLNNNFIINNVNAYPPGRLTAMFAKFLIDNNLVKNKVVADIGSGCFALGIIAIKNGANTIIGSDVSQHAIQCAKDNLVLHGIAKNVYLFKGDGVLPLLPKFIGKIDIIVSGIPWDNLSTNEFDSLIPERQAISRAFYDVDDALIKDIMLQGFNLLSHQGRIFITSSIRKIERIQQLCLEYQLNCKIVKEDDIHNDGNIHYILEITRIR
ncbi:modification methylase HemK [Rickettsia rhipicephali]|uniref:50S ribosomal protein L11 methyltransferase n=1 Tax=Rickettsia rhipicephali TaxID=33992 RepID=UPI000710A69D|nr:50S ribosomal protein L11 methyltransferase [Rickettsia rhipicephali]ALN40722.1 modification methylase HemK [Rickettsia rhipicephali]ALN40881.1 modification methylase HemK [Rickettsia rhipicephali]